MKATALAPLAPLSVPEIRRLLLARETSPERGWFLVAWSHFRRTHQAHAARAHAARAHAARRAHTPSETPPPAAVPVAALAPVLWLAGTATVTEATWAQIAPLLPTLQVAPKRTCYEHRRVLDGILGVMRSGRSWREGPVGDIPWPILYQRYSLWRRRGIWGMILRILHPETDALFVT